MKEIGKECEIQNDCQINPDQVNFNELFHEDWEVFVIRHDPATGKHNWFTECCEKIVNTLNNIKKHVATDCC